MILVLVYVVFVFITPWFKSDQNNKFSYSFYAAYFLMNTVNAITTILFYIAIGAFQARVSDKSLGGVCI